MITQIIVNRCTKCQSEHIVKNGKTKAGRQKYRCKACGSYGTLNPSVQYTPERKAEILRAYHERSSLRGIERTFGVARQTVAKWLKEKANSLPEMPPLKEAQPGDVLELDELWSFVESKKTNDGFG
jgi:transposase-like protein